MTTDTPTPEFKKQVFTLEEVVELLKQLPISDYEGDDDFSFEYISIDNRDEAIKTLQASKATMQDVVNGTAKGNAAVERALVNAHADMEAVSEQASPLTELDDVELRIELIHDYKPGDILCLQLSQIPDAKAAIQSLIARKEREAMLLEAKHRCDDALGRLLRLDRDKTIEYLKEYLHGLQGENNG